MEAIRKKSIELTAQLYAELSEMKQLKILTSSNQEERGAQLSVYVAGNRPDLEKTLSDHGLICDYRQDNLAGSEGGVLRLAPAPLYNTMDEVKHVSELLAASL